ncbi:MAG: DUF1345 domain-containing protein [Rhodospirillales bacterium]|nr:DUF1345 domain-containing protein [Rhodospirillales bacterium]MDE2320015.1 DUF1345 domain-containing protein [Rhodospirillales bacterium]
MKSFRLFQILRARPFFTICYGIGALAWVLMFPLKNPAVRAVAAWDTGSLLYLAVTLTMFFLTEDRDISLDAKSHHEGEWTVFTLTLLGAGMSFASLFLFSHAANQKAHFTGAYLAFVVLTLALSWAVTHLTFAYRYAHEYYSYDLGGETVDGGIEFPKDNRPDYLDFVYFSFVLGMTFQVSDCNVTSKKLRRLATMQGLIGFVFNTVILALSVNIAASLL